MNATAGRALFCGINYFLSNGSTKTHADFICVVLKAKVFLMYIKIMSHVLRKEKPTADLSVHVV